MLKNDFDKHNLYVLVMSHTRFRVNPDYSCLNFKECTEAGVKSEV